MDERLTTPELMELYEADLRPWLDAVSWIRDLPEDKRSHQNKLQLEAADEITHWLGLLSGPADGDPRLIGWVPREPITGVGGSFLYAYFGILKKRPAITIYMLDGTPFKRAAMETILGNNSDPLRGILAGQPDCTGELWREWNLPTIFYVDRGKKGPLGPSWNGAIPRQFQDIPYGTDDEEDAKDLIRNYNNGQPGLLRYDWRTWRKDLAELYAESHSGAVKQDEDKPLGPRLPGMLNL